MKAQANNHVRDVLPILHRFEKRKPTILGNLRDIHQKGPNTEPFDEKGAWDGLKYFSYFYVARPIARNRTRLSPDIRERFNKLAIDVEQVRLQLSELIESNELRHAVDAGQRIGVEVIQELASVNSLAALQAAFHEVCKVPVKLGRPHDRALWPGDVEHLAELYAESTGRKPGSGKGPFARFVQSVLSALGQNVSESHVIDVIKIVARGKKSPTGKKSSKSD
jgi:hypothetical protein